MRRAYPATSPTAQSAAHDSAIAAVYHAVRPAANLTAQHAVHGEPQVAAIRVVHFNTYPRSG